MGLMTEFNRCIFVEFYKTSRNEQYLTACLYLAAKSAFFQNKMLQKMYAERYDWIKIMFKDWAFTFITAFLFYNDKDTLTDEKNPLRLCKHCQNAFIASRPNVLFCSNKFKNQYNVYKTRNKDKED